MQLKSQVKTPKTTLLSRNELHDFHLQVQFRTSYNSPKHSQKDDSGLKNPKGN